MPDPHRVILFDGVCNLCSGLVQFILKTDKNGFFKLSSLQSNYGQSILKKHGMALDNFQTLIYLEGETLFTRSSAFLKIVKLLPRPWRFLSVLRWLPKWFLDWGYDRVANYRYQWFGKKKTCFLPSEENRNRFL